MELLAEGGDVGLDAGLVAHAQSPCYRHIRSPEVPTHRSERPAPCVRRVMRNGRCPGPRADALRAPSYRAPECVQADHNSLQLRIRHAILSLVTKHASMLKSALGPPLGSVHGHLEPMEDCSCASAMKASTCETYVSNDLPGRMTTPWRDWPSTTISSGCSVWMWRTYLVPWLIGL